MMKSVPQTIQFPTTFYIERLEDMGKRIDLKAAAERSGKSESYLRRLCRRSEDDSNTLPYFKTAQKFGNAWTIDEDELAVLDDIDRGRPKET